MKKLFTNTSCICLSFLWLFTACDNQSSDTTLSGYFKLEPLLSDQIYQFGNTNPQVFKKVTLDGKTEEAQLRPDSLEWSKEFEIFLTVDINRPSLVGAFETTATADKMSYSRKNKEDDGVKDFVVVFHEDTKVPKAISILSSTENSLYTSNRIFQLNFDNKNGKPILSSYSIDGTQTILSRSATRYQLEGRLIF